MKQTLLLLLLLLCGTAFASILVKVAPKPFTLQPIEIGIAEGQSFSVDVTLYTTGGTAPYSCSLDANNPLPSWMRLNGCVLSGTAPAGTQASEYSVCLTINDAKQKSAKSCQ